MFKKNSYFFILLKWFLILIFVPLFIIYIYTTDFIKNFYLDNIKNDLYENAIKIKEIYYNDFIFGHGENICHKLVLIDKITIIDNLGNVICNNIELHKKLDNLANRPEIIEIMNLSINTNEQKNFRYSTTLQQDTIYLAIPVIFENKLFAIIKLSKNYSHVNKLILSIYLEILSIGLLSGAIAFILAFIIVKKMQIDINKIENLAKDYSKGIFRRNIHIDKPKEFYDLTQSLIEMSEQLKQKIDNLNLQKDELDKLLGSIDEIVLVINKEQKIIKFNNSAQKTFDFETKSNLFLHEISRNSKLIKFIEKNLSVLNNIEEDLILDIYEKELFFQAKAYPIYNNNIKIYTLFIFNNITRIKKLEQLQKEFVANVSHELKTPLTCIKSYSETLINNSNINTDNTQKFLQIIYNNTELLEEIINNLLFLAKLENTKDNIEKNTINLENLISIIIKEQNLAIKEKNITIQIKNTNIDIFTNLILFKLLLLNIINNAIKYNRNNGFINIYTLNQNNILQIFVEDNGMGIKITDFSKIFERFYRIDEAHNRQIKGSGLGLAIAKQIANKLSFNIYVYSSNFNGTTFVIQL